MGEEGVGVVTDVEEDYFDVFRLEDLLQGYVVGFGEGREGGGAKGVDVDEVDFGGRRDEDGYEGDGAVAGEVVAFEVDVEGGIGLGG